MKERSLLSLSLLSRYHRVYQCEPESGTINQISEYEIPSSRHSLAHLACDQQSSVFLAYQYPAVSLDLWHISPMATWALIKRWTPRELFPPSPDDDDDDEESGVCGIASMRYANETLHILARHERQWCLHLFTVLNDEKHQPRLLLQRRIDIDPVHLRLAGENFQMEILPEQQGWLFAIRRPFLIHLDANGKDGQFSLLDCFISLRFRSSASDLGHLETGNGLHRQCLHHGRTGQTAREQQISRRQRLELHSILQTVNKSRLSSCCCCCSSDSLLFVL